VPGQARFHLVKAHILFVGQQDFAHLATVAFLLATIEGHLSAEHDFAEVLLRFCAVRLTVLGRVNARQADAALNIPRSKDIDRVAVVNADYFGGKRFLCHGTRGHHQD